MPSRTAISIPSTPASATDADASDANMSPATSPATSPLSANGTSGAKFQSSDKQSAKAEDETFDDANDPSISSTMRAAEEEMARSSNAQEAQRAQRLEEQRQKDLAGGKEAVDTKFKALEYLLSQSKLYSTIMLQQMQKEEAHQEAKDAKNEKTRQTALVREERAEAAATESQRRITRAAGGEEQANDVDADAGKKRGRPSKTKTKDTGKLTNYFSKADLERAAGDQGANVKSALKEHTDASVQTQDIGFQSLRSARQPALVSGGAMRGYQLEGLEWLTSLYENGLNGILADEMGLGKTVQTISFIAFLREKGTMGPFLIAAPLSTTNNWVDEFTRWTPSIPVVLYHGSKQEREEIRKKRLRNPGSDTFPIVCTSYEICMNDRKFLAHMGWKFIIIDEGHRIKNLNCRLIRELQSYQSANRLLITGTPLQNNLTELWSLLHFLMPDIFDKLEAFESWFDFSALKERGGHEQLLSESRRAQLVASLHAILKPFLLRRVKADVEHALPKKREYVLYAPLLKQQRQLYEAILNGSSREWLESRVVETLSRPASTFASAAPSGTATPQTGQKRKSGPQSRRSTPASKSRKTSGTSTPATNGSARGRRAKRRTDYSEVSDTQYFKHIDDGSDEEEEQDESSDEYTKTLALARKHIAGKKLQNPVMQLRLCCNSPHNFYDPWAGSDDADVDYQELVRASGKMQVLDELLRALLGAKADHKILIFSQFKSQLDLIEMYCEYVLKTFVCRIDGAVAAADRAEQIKAFNTKSEHRVFLLSTRAGGQGINLAAADTVILFDSDWNPQQDLQAQDRAHRIGQRRPVIVYRLASRGTVEEVLLEKADGKRRLEKLVIRQGRFKSWGREARNGGTAKHEDDEDGDNDNLDELRRLLGQADGERLDVAAGEAEEEEQTGGQESKGTPASVRGRRSGQKGAPQQRRAPILSAADLETLLDRSDEAYSKAEAAAAAASNGGSAGTDKAGALSTFQAVETRDGHGLLTALGQA